MDQLKDEIRKYTDPESKLRKPDYFIFATNVVLTPVLENGSKDRAVAALRNSKTITYERLMPLGLRPNPSIS